MRVHFIAIGGSAMHNLALALHDMGHDVSGSDDEIFEPSKSRLKKAGLLPPSNGWYPGRISKDLDAVILGMHARKDNPELLKAQELDLKIYSYPEFIYEESERKTRVVIAGSHGKTTITAMILHVLHYARQKFDFMVGAQLNGFNRMVQITEAPMIILEGDEYLSSPIDMRPKFLWYKPQIALLSGISWDHINVFPTFDEYLDAFRQFLKSIPQGAKIAYFSGDEHLQEMVMDFNQIDWIPYSTPQYRVDGSTTWVRNHKSEWIRLGIFGVHNLQNMEGAHEVLRLLGISDDVFYEAISSFTGASKRLESLAESPGTHVFKDFAHAPSKLKATTRAVKEQWPDRKLVAVFELHTFSSLNKSFLSQYKGTLDEADVGLVFYLPDTLKHKNLPAVSTTDIMTAFDRMDILTVTKPDQLERFLLNLNWENTNLLFMSSGNYGGIDLEKLAEDIVKSA